MLGIHEKLTNEGHLTMSLFTLRYHYRKHCKQASQKPITSSKTVVPVAPAAPAPSHIVTLKNDKATRPENINLEDVV